MTKLPDLDEEFFTEDLGWFSYNQLVKHVIFLEQSIEKLVEEANGTL